MDQVRYNIIEEEMKQHTAQLEEKRASEDTFLRAGLHNIQSIIG
jgi:hypothetical protein